MKRSPFYAQFVGQFTYAEVERISVFQSATLNRKRCRGKTKVSGTNGTVVAEVISSTVFTQFFLEDVSRLLHKRIAVAAAFDYARLKTAGAVADSALGDAFQKLIANSS